MTRAARLGRLVLMWLLVPAAYVVGRPFLSSVRFDPLQRLANGVGLFLIFGSLMLLLRPMRAAVTPDRRAMRMLLLLCTSLAAVGLGLLVLTRDNTETALF